MADYKLLGQPQPTYPLINVQIHDQGVTIVIALGPQTMLTQSLDGVAMDQICSQWIENRNARQQEAALVNRVLQEKKRLN